MQHTCHLILLSSCHTLEMAHYRVYKLEQGYSKTISSSQLQNKHSDLWNPSFVNSCDTYHAYRLLVSCLSYNSTKYPVRHSRQTAIYYEPLCSAIVTKRLTFSLRRTSDNLSTMSWPRTWGWQRQKPESIKHKQKIVFVICDLDNSVYPPCGGKFRGCFSTPFVTQLHPSHCTR